MLWRYRMNSKRTYVALGILFFISVIVYVLSPVGAIQNIAAIPTIGALCAALFVILRDRIAYERAMFTLEVQNSFAIGAMSHLANVAFDKHVLFCEEYVEEMSKALNTLFRRGPHRDALPHANALYDIRRKWTVWLTPEVQIELDRFEHAIRTIGNNERLVSDYPGMDQRQKLIEQMYTLFAKVIGEKEWQGKMLTEEFAISSILEKLREILGVRR
jgi:hypothetical protein